MSTLRWLIVSSVVLLCMLTRGQAQSQQNASAHDIEYEEITSTDDGPHLYEQQTNAVIELTDSNLGSLTQIDGTSMTSGDWMIMFYAPWCGHCQKLHPTWEQVAQELRGAVNVAALDAIDNEQAAQRFEIKGFPTIYYLHHQGYMFEYDSNDRSTHAFTSWALALAETANVTSLDGKHIPRPLTSWQRVEAFVTQWATDMERILTLHFVVAMSLVALGVLLGVALTSVILLFTLDQPSPPPTYQPIPQQVKKSQ
jgi:protein disulfide-isomerase-like protein